jgi:hypothetical protein
MNRPRTEGGVVVGNTSDKYGPRHPIARGLADRFLSAFDAFDV